ncbi:hypothetical protein ANCCEY_11888 [Ancylostoma ceylanicum]|uniref:Uncharacterized protein n=1 Tax=Ancylostoma ceylanicum TaxID=53326 RepID=A0A0D6LAW8_9BILA|nr:hypothetical protein ANCCEY_11888 [Ancylostoma ceylanicum]
MMPQLGNTSPCDPPDPLLTWPVPAPSHRAGVRSRKRPPRHRTSSRPQRLQHQRAGRGADFPEREHPVARGFPARTAHRRSNAVSLRR